MSEPCGESGYVGRSRGLPPFRPLLPPRHSRYVSQEAGGETWVYPKSEDVLRAAHLRTIRESIAQRRQTVFQAIADRPILEACRGAERRRGSPTRLYWWEQDFEAELSTEEEDEEEEAGPLISPRSRSRHVVHSLN